MEPRNYLKGIGKFIPMITAGYGKRMLENVYTEAMNTPAGQKLKNLGKRDRYAIELLLNFFSAFIDEKLKEDTTLKKIVKEIVIDAGPEISKRLINGDNVFVDEDKINEVRKKISFHSDKSHSEKERDILERLLEMEDFDLVAFLDWIYRQDEQERKVILRKFSELSEKGLKNVLNLSEDDLNRIIALKQPRLSFKETIERGLRNWTKKLKEKNDQKEGKQ